MRDPHHYYVRSVGIALDRLLLWSGVLSDGGDITIHRGGDIATCDCYLLMFGA